MIIKDNNWVVTSNQKLRLYMSPRENCNLYDTKTDMFEIFLSECKKMWQKNAGAGRTILD